MNKSLEEIATIFNGTDYKQNPAGDTVPIYGTGGLMGYTSVVLNQGPAVLSGRKGSINNPIYVEGDFWNVDTIFCIKTKEGVDTKWLYYNFLNTDLSKLNEATGVPSVTSKALYKLTFNWVEFPEQRKIAGILSTADSVIDRTRAAIAKYQAVKQGMLNDLFRRGIDPHTGSLRPGPEDASELYRDSPLGKVPKDWDVDQLKNLTDLIVDGTHFTPQYTEFGIPFLRVTDVQTNDIDLNKVKFISEREHQELTKRCKPLKGDTCTRKMEPLEFPNSLIGIGSFQFSSASALSNQPNRKLRANI
jgi:type I restriction enzyme S subunit